MTPLPFTWDGEAMQIRPGFQRQADGQFCVGETYRLEVVEPRSEISHRHEFAWLREAWASLPFDLAMAHPTAEHLRKWALIQAGFCTVADYACMFKTETHRLAASLRQQTDEYAVVIVDEENRVVRVLKPESQSMRAMGNERFKASKAAIMDVVSGLIGVPVDVLAEQREAA